MDSIAKEHSAVKHKDRPEYINLEGFETGTNDSHQENKGDSFPHLDFAHGSDKRLVISGYHLVETDKLLVDKFIFIRLFFHETLGGKVTDDQL